jgi:hypothetical protein
MDQPPGAGDLLDRMQVLVGAAADERAGWIRANLKDLMSATGRDPGGISALSGVSATTVRAFLAGTDSSLTNVLKMANTLGVSLVDLERPPDQFAAVLEQRRRRR